jgi:E3 ubiquitin-protein ligase RNF1/2
MTAIESLDRLLQEDFECSICLEQFQKPHINAGCGHRFCRDCIKESLRLCNNECPICRATIRTYRSMKLDSHYEVLVSIFRTLLIGAYN